MAAAGGRRVRGLVLDLTQVNTAEHRCGGNCIGSAKAEHHLDPNVLERPPEAFAPGRLGPRLVGEDHIQTIFSSSGQYTAQCVRTLCYELVHLVDEEEMG